MIEPDMRIAESDLHRAAALDAARVLAGRIERDELDGEFEYGVLNQLKIIEGHVLREQARAVARERGDASVEAIASRAMFCRWLVDEGFWYD